MSLLFAIIHYLKNKEAGNAEKVQTTNLQRNCEATNRITMAWRITRLPPFQDGKLAVGSNKVAGQRTAYFILRLLTVKLYGTISITLKLLKNINSYTE